MTRTAIFAAVVAVVAAVPAHAQTVGMSDRHDAGGPNFQNNRCWVNTDSRGHGFWDRCDPLTLTSRPRALSLRDIPQTQIDAIESGGGGDGGGGGGGGGR
jgi:hypothetical protein